MPSSGDDLILMVPIHVDDGLAITNSIPLYTWFISELSKELEIADLGPVSMFLVIHIHCDCPSQKQGGGRMWIPNIGWEGGVQPEAKKK